MPASGPLFFVRGREVQAAHQREGENRVVSGRIRQDATEREDRRVKGDTAKRGGALPAFAAGRPASGVRATRERPESTEDGEPAERILFSAGSLCI